MTWSDGGAHFDLVKETKDRDGQPLSTWGLGILFVGDKGMLAADYGRLQLLPQDKFAGFKPPEQTIPASIGHWHEWVQACKTGCATTCNFDYSGALTETVLLGIVAFRTGEKLDWDAAEPQGHQQHQGRRVPAQDLPQRLRGRRPEGVSLLARRLTRSRSAGEWAFHPATACAAASLWLRVKRAAAGSRETSRSFSAPPVCATVSLSSCASTSCAPAIPRNRSLRSVVPPESARISRPGCAAFVAPAPIRVPPFRPTWYENRPVLAAVSARLLIAAYNFALGSSDAQAPELCTETTASGGVSGTKYRHPRAARLTAAANAGACESRDRRGRRG